MELPKNRPFLATAQERVKKNFKNATLSFIFIIAYVNVFQLIFGAENSIVGVIFAIMMSASMVRDLTSTPFKHLIIQAFVLVLMAVSACLVSYLNPWAALPINFIMIFFILYSFTYEYSSNLYFPYILSYLFLIFISPVTPDRLPMRILAMLTGAVSIILYQLVMGRKRAEETVQDVLLIMIDEAKQYTVSLLSGDVTPDSLELVRKNLRRLSRMVYDRRKRELCISDANFAVVDSGRGLEHLIILLDDFKAVDSHREMLKKIGEQLDNFRVYVKERTEKPVIIAREEFITSETDEVQQTFYDALDYIQNHLIHMTDPEKRLRFRPAILSLSIRIQSALKISQVRLVYALRVAILLSIGTLLVNSMELPHGKWLMFTMASVSLPYADDVGTKAKKRFLATLIGGVISMVIYALIPYPAGRTAAMMLSGYASFYLTDYTGTFACSTIGALGGAVFMNVFGWVPVGQILLIRIGYVCAGIVIAYVANCLIFPYHRKTSTTTLLGKYAFATDLLTKICGQSQVDTQFYYHLIIQSHLIEEKLYQDTPAEYLSSMQDRINACRSKVRDAHRKRSRMDQPLMQ